MQEAWSTAWSSWCFPYWLPPFLEVCVSNSYKVFLVPLYPWRFSLGPTAYLLPVLMEFILLCSAAPAVKSVCLLCGWEESQNSCCSSWFFLCLQRCQFKSLLLGGSKPLLIDRLRIWHGGNSTLKEPLPESFHWEKTTLFMPVVTASEIPPDQKL